MATLSGSTPAFETRTQNGPIRIMHLTTGLDVGGAEMMLYKLVTGLPRSRFDTKVVSLLPPGAIADRIERAGIATSSLGMRRGVPNPIAILRLARNIRDWRPDILQTWMYHADLLGAATGWTRPHLPLIWNVRHNQLDARNHKLTTLLTVRLCAALSRMVPARIVCCSESASRSHIALGYDARKIDYIPNGIDLDQFGPMPDARQDVARELGIPAGVPVVLSVARFHPDKNHRGLIEAIARVITVRPNCRFVLCGQGVTRENRDLTADIDAAGCGSRIHLLGHRSDIPRLMSAATVIVSASSSESFPNVIAEAMACGSCCVVTDVGDSALIIGNSGIVVPAGDPAPLAEGILSVLAMAPMERSKMGYDARKRVMRLFNLSDVIVRYEQLYAELA